jgi:putative phosphoribosyl transferase
MREVLIEDSTLRLPGLLGFATASQGLVIFAHGSGSSRLSPRNQFVAQRLNEAGISTLLFDLLTPAETRDRSNVFDIPLLTGRLEIATRWAQHQAALKGQAIGYFGASTGAAAALVAAAHLGNQIAAVVSRGGRPDLALPWLSRVCAPTLLLIGGADTEVIALNAKAAAQLERSATIIIPGASHLFEEPGTLELVCTHAVAWFARHFAVSDPLAGPGAAPSP